LTSEIKFEIPATLHTRTTVTRTQMQNKPNAKNTRKNKQTSCQTGSTALSASTSPSTSASQSTSTLSSNLQHKAQHNCKRTAAKNCRALVALWNREACQGEERVVLEDGMGLGPK